MRAIQRTRDTLIWALPLLLPLVPALLALAVGSSETSRLADDVFLVLPVIPAFAVVGAVVRAGQSMRLGVSAGEAWLNALGAAAVGVVFGVLVWWQAVEASCRGRYECPF